MKYNALLTAVALSYSGGAFAQETQSSEAQTKMKIEETKEANKVSGDIDTEITNAKLRAESGSKSKWSGSFTGAYYGGSLETPLSEFRPNISQETTPPRVFMAGDIAIRYRANKNNSFTLGTGASLQQPFQNPKYGDVSDPYLGYNHVRKIGGVQSITSATVVVPTNNDERTLGMQANTAVSQTMMYDFGGSRFSAGLAFTADYTFYKNNKYDVISYRNTPDDKFTAGAAQRDYSLAVYPMAEYALSDRVQLRTVFRPWIFDHSVLRPVAGKLTETDGLTFRKRRWTQSFGVGVAVARDIYLYPNFQWDVEQWRGKDYNFFAKEVRANSTVGLQATLNVF